MKKYFAIALTGTPGTGKTGIARILKKKGFAEINLNREIRKHKLYSGYDRKRKTYVADMKKVEKFLKKELKSERYKNRQVIIDSHLSHLLLSSIVNAVIVLRCDSEELEKRLIKRRWGREKVRENVESEIIGLIEYEARKKHEKVFVVDTTKLAAEQVARIIEQYLTRNDKDK